MPPRPLFEHSRYEVIKLKAFGGAHGEIPDVPSGGGEMERLFHLERRCQFFQTGSQSGDALMDVIVVVKLLYLQVPNVLVDVTLVLTI